MPRKRGKRRKADRKCCLRKWPPTPVFLPGKLHGQRNLAGCRPWGRKESDTTEHEYETMSPQNGNFNEVAL